MWSLKHYRDSAWLKSACRARRHLTVSEVFHPGAIPSHEHSASSGPDTQSNKRSTNAMLQSEIIDASQKTERERNIE